MTVRETLTGEQLAPAKTPMNRLLDMVAGWAEYIQDLEEAPDTPGMVDLVCDLYQKTGEVAFTKYASPEEEDAAIRKFLISGVLPVLVAR